MILPKKLQYYLSIQREENPEVYETILTFLLIDEFRELITTSIILAEKTTLSKNKDGHIIANYTVVAPSNYDEIIRNVLKNDYVKENYSSYEILRIKNILKNFPMDFAIRVIEFDVPKFKEIPRKLSFQNMTFPTISYKDLSKKDSLQITFHKETSRKEVNNFIEQVLQLENKPRKRKKALGKQFSIAFNT